MSTPRLEVGLLEWKEVRKDGAWAGKFKREVFSPLLAGRGRRLAPSEGRRTL